MSSIQISEEAVSTTQNNLTVKRVLSVFDNETDELMTEYPLHGFDLKQFKQRFRVEEEIDPLMFNVYPLSPADADFVSEYLDEAIAFDFDANAYFVECFSVE